MGRWKDPRGAVIRGALLFFVVLLFFPLVTAEGPLLPPADLSVELELLEAGPFGYSVSVVISNMGGSVSRTCALGIWDEHDVLTGNGSLVLDHTIQELQPDRSVTVDLEWHPTTPSVHRLWAFADPENEVTELTRYNNMAFRTVRLPSMPDIELSVDGMVDEDIAGTYISGVPFELKVLSTIEDSFGPDLHRFELYLDNGTTPLRSWSGGTGSEPTFDVGSLPPGEHTMTVDVSYSGVSIGSKTLFVRMASLPAWTSTLSELEVIYDHEVGAYSLSGSLDIPRLEVLPSGGNITPSGPLVLFDHEGEVRTKAWVLPDGTTTFELGLTAGLPISKDGSPLRAEARSFNGAPSLPDGITMRATSDVGLDLSDHLAASPLELGRENCTLAFDPAPVVMEGGLELEVFMGQAHNGSATLQGSLSMGLDGKSLSTVFPDSLCGPGGSATVSTVARWETLSELGPDGRWATSGNLDLERSTSVMDLMDPERKLARSFVSMSDSRDGATSAVHVTPWEGNRTALGLWTEGSSLLLREVHGRMAEPCIADLGDGGLFVLWTEASSPNGTQPADLADRDLMWMQVDSSMVVRRKASTLFGGPHLDMLPSVASSTNGSTLLLTWVRDHDRDATTLHDRTVMAASYNGTDWTVPCTVPTGSGDPPSSAISLFTEANVPAIAAVDVKGAAHLRGISLTDRNISVGPPISIPHPDGTKVLDLSPLMSSGGAMSRTGLLVTRSGAKGEGRSVISVIALSWSSPILPEGERVIASSDHMVEGLCGDQTELGYTAVMWREASDGNGSLKMAASPAGGGWDTWTPPLGLDPTLPLTPSFSFRSLENGQFWTMMGREAAGPDNSTLEPLRVSLEDLTWACDIISLKATAAEDYAPGDMATLRVTVMNRGLRPDGAASLRLIRSVRSRENGTLEDQNVLSEMVSFTTLNERKEITYSVLIGDMQAGFVALTSTPSGVLAEHRDEMYVSLSAYPDPVVTASVLEQGQPGGNVTIKVTLSNMGHSKLDQHPLVLMVDGPSPPAAFGPGRMEPVRLRGMEGGSIGPVFNISLDPFQEVTYMFGYRPLNGTTVVWPEVQGCGWLHEVPRSSMPIVVRRYPVLALDLVLDGPLHALGGPGSIDVLVTNTGSSGPFDIPDKGGAVPLPEGMRYLNPSVVLSLWLMNVPGSTFEVFEGEVTVPPPGSMTRSSFQVPGEHLVAGRALVWAEVGSESAMIGGSRLGSIATAEISTPPPNVLEAASVNGAQTTSGAFGFSVLVRNPTNRNTWGTLVELSNGRPEDGVVLSDHMMMTAGRNDSSAAVVSVPLKEGSYLLSVSVRSFPSHAMSSSDGMVAMDVVVFEHDVVEKEVSPGPDGPDSYDITSSSLVAGAALFAVLAIATLFRLRTKEKE